tara:strand:+ start:971 stop:1174 length:204 start_codon:yes stop_codon:yes gene_type:complete
MNQRTQQVILKREIDRVLQRAFDELELSYFSVIGVLDVSKAEIIEALAEETFIQQCKDDQQDTDTDD